ncbi:hypothetical protein SNOG_12708 [Parastagonospora nodorum SN15]|uniref:Uncharacterized protein n=1 Tax=Phaeosphaeria nodorum (strain SN15 / ATCC MYA-4574 / FGSC 10173) TaxID=321614 RepID=Q0U6A6_PHANO|nr:hypothetical protein SNOG_12708 [Parastagonospora nodorum SN15]EAT80006.1 hypothetical protein SNOG_12708 [Parastagonospora nodorum SN15]
MSTLGECVSGTTHGWCDADVVVMRLSPQFEIQAAPRAEMMTTVQPAQ